MALFNLSPSFEIHLQNYNKMQRHLNNFMSTYIYINIYINNIYIWQYIWQFKQTCMLKTSSLSPYVTFLHTFIIFKMTLWPVLPKTLASNSTSSNCSLTCSHHITLSLSLSGDKPPVVSYRSLALSAPNGPSVWPPIRLPSLQYLWIPGWAYVCEDYSALSAPKSTLLKSASQTEMVFKKRYVCTAACGELRSVHTMYAFSVT